MRNVVNAIEIKKYINEKKPMNVVIAGTGFIGLELLETISNYDIEITLVEVQNKNNSKFGL